MSVTYVGVTGHRGLSPRTSGLVDVALRGALADLGGEVVGVSCLADGADTLFARAVLDAGGRIEVIVPAVAYREGLPRAHWPVYDALIAEATVVHRLDFAASTSQAHMAASRRMLDRCDRLLAVWDGLPARGYGGTADVVAVAHDAAIPVTVIWPEGATRDNDDQADEQP